MRLGARYTLQSTNTQAANLLAARQVDCLVREWGAGAERGRQQQRDLEVEK